MSATNERQRMPALLTSSIARFRHQYIRSELGERTWTAALGELTDDERAQIEKTERGARMPARTEGRLLDLAVLHRLGDDHPAIDRFCRIGGSRQADNMFDGVFGVFARLVTPTQALQLGPTIIGAAYSGVHSAAETDEHTGGLVLIEGLGELTYAGPWISGWMEHSIERFGGTSAKVHERGWDAGEISSDRLRFVVTWS
jgi:hypothetical protein